MEWRGEGRYGSSRFIHNFSIKTMTDSNGIFKACFCSEGKLIADYGRSEIPPVKPGVQPTVALTNATLRPHFI